MAEGKNIEIKIAATGGDQAAAEISKVAQASEAAQSTGFGGMNDNSAPRDEAHEKRLAQIASETEAIQALAAEQAKSVEDEIAGMKEKEEAAANFATELDAQADAEKRTASANDTRMKAAAIGAIAAAAGAATKTLANVFENIEKINTADLSQIDAQLAGQIEQMKTLAAAASDPIGALVALANGGKSIEAEFAELNEAIRLNAEQREAAVDRVIQRGIIQVDAIKKLSEDLRAANALLDAKDSADSAARDRTDARAIREGADPNDVRAKRAEDDAAKEFEKIERDTAVKRGPLKELESNADTSRAVADDLQAKAAAAQEKLDALRNERDALKAELEGTSMFNFPAMKDIKGRVTQNVQDRDGIEKSMPSADTVAQAEASAAEKKKAYDDQRKIAQAADLEAEQKRREVREKSQAIVEDAAGDKVAKQREEEHKKAQEEAREAARKASEESRNERANARQKEADDRRRESEERRANKGIEYQSTAAVAGPANDPFDKDRDSGKQRPGKPNTPGLDRLAAMQEQGPSKPNTPGLDRQAAMQDRSKPDYAADEQAAKQRSALDGSFGKDAQRRALERAKRNAEQPAGPERQDGPQDESVAKARDKVGQLAGRPQKSNQGGDVQELLGMVNRLVDMISDGSANQDGGESRKDMDDLKRKVENLQGQIKNNRRDIR